MIVFPTPKDPDDIDDFTIEWAARLATGETLSSLTCVGTGVTVDSSTIVGTTTVARLSAGVAGTPATVRYRVVTSTGRQFDETAQIRIEAQ